MKSYSYYLEVFTFEKGPHQIGHIEINQDMTAEHIGFRVKNLIDRHKQSAKLAEDKHFSVISR